MIVNGNLKLHTLGDSEFQNVILERLTTAARDALTGGDLVAGRLIYNTSTNTYDYYDGTNWVAFGTGGNVAAVQNELDTTQTSMGYVNADGTFNASSLNALTNVNGLTGSSTLVDALADLDAAITAAAGVDTLAELTDVNLTSPTQNDFLVRGATQWNNLAPSAAQQAMGVEVGVDVQAFDADLSAIAGLTHTGGEVIYSNAGTWAAAATGATSGVQKYDAMLDSVANNTGTGVMVATSSGDTLVVRTLAVDGAGATAGLTVTNGDGVLGAPTFGLDVNGLAAAAGDPVSTDVFVVYDGTNNEKVTLSQVRGGVLTLGVALNDLSDVVITAAASNEFLMFDGNNWVDTTPAAARTGLDVYSKAESNSNFVDAAGDTMTGNLVMSAGTDVKLPDQPVNATDAANKAYVDTVAAGQQWKNAIVDPNFVGIASDTPTSPTADTGYIAAGTGTYTGAWNTAGVSKYDYVVWNAAGNAWIIVDNIDGKNARFGVAMESGAADSSLTGIGIVTGDLVEYVGGTGGDTTLAASWSHPEGMNGTHTAVNIVSITVATDTVKLSGDQTLHFFPGNRITLAGTTAHDGEYTIQSATLNAGNTDIVTIEDLTGSDQAAVGTATSEIFDGVTVLVSDPESEHQGHSFLYQELSNSWVQVSGPGTVGAGVGLSYSGNVLNVNLGAGIVELPTDEVGVDVYSGGGLITTTDGSTSSTVTGAQLAIKLDGGTLALSTNGIKVATGGITNTEVSGSAAIALSKLASGTSAQIIVANGSGVPTYVAMSGDVTIDNLGATTIGAGKVTNAMLVNDNLTLAADTGTPEVANLGETVTIAGGTGIASAVSATNTVTLNYNGGLNDQSDATITSAASGDTLVHDGTDFKNVPIQVVLNQTTSSNTWTVSHNLGQKFVNVTVYDSTDNVIIPQSIVATDANTTTITFNTAITGTAVVMGVPGATVI